MGTIIRLFLGIVWIWSASLKIGSPREFLLVVRAFDATPEWLTKAIAFGLPVLELALGVLLIVGIVVRLAAAASAVLFVIFLIGVIQAAARGLKLDCGCFGSGGQTAGATHYTWDILRDIGLLALALFLVWWPVTRLSLDEFLARHDYVEPPSAKRLRTEQGRRKYESEVAKRDRAARSRNRWTNGAIAGVVVLVTLIGVGVQSGRAKIGGTLTATNATVRNGVVFGKKAAATVDIWLDYQCPNCRRFEQNVGPTLDKLVRANHAQARYHVVAFLDESSNGNRYSSRAANAAICASDVSVDTFIAYNDVLFGKIDGKQVQPKEGTSGRTDTQLEAYARRAGITGDKLTTFAACVADEQHKSFVAATTDSASRRGITGTPTVKVNGKRVAATLGAVTKAIAAAGLTGPAPSPSVTPSPTTSKSASPSPTKSATPPAATSRSSTPAG